MQPHDGKSARIAELGEGQVTAIGELDHTTDARGRDTVAVRVLPLRHDSNPPVA
jgi:hypothetical protein